MAHTKSSSNIVQYDSNGSVRATSFRYNQNSVNTVGGMAYTLQSSDDGKTIVTTNILPVTITIPTGLNVGFRCEIIQSDVGSASLSAAEGVTLNSVGGNLSVSERHSGIRIKCIASNTFNVRRDIS